jgi:hypothetical protein
MAASFDCDQPNSTDAMQRATQIAALRELRSAPRPLLDALRHRCRIAQPRFGYVCNPGQRPRLTNRVGVVECRNGLQRHVGSITDNDLTEDIARGTVRATASERELAIRRLYRQTLSMTNPSAKIAQAISVAFISFLAGSYYARGSWSALTVAGISLLAALYFLLKDFWR